MNYFNDVVLFDKVWSFEYGYGQVIEIKSNFFEVDFNCCVERYNFDGVRYGYYNCNQTLFLDKVIIDVSKKQKIKLKEFNYRIDIDYDEITRLDLDKKLYTIAINNGLTRIDEKTAEKALKQIKRFTRLLALRDQECPDSRGYVPKKDELKFAISYDTDKEKYVMFSMYNLMPDKIFFKTKEDAELICDILNEGIFKL